MTLVDNAGHGFGAPVTGGAGKLSGRQPGSLVPDARLESGIELGKLPLQAGLTLAGHTDLRCRGYPKIRGPFPGRNSTGVPFIAYTWRGCPGTCWYTRTCAIAPPPN